MEVGSSLEELAEVMTGSLDLASHFLARPSLLLFLVILIITQKRLSIANVSRKLRFILAFVSILIQNVPRASEQSE